MNAVGGYVGLHEIVGGKTYFEMVHPLREANKNSDEIKVY